MPKYLAHADHYDSSAPGDSLRAVDVYVPDGINSSESHDMLIFIHGGAWRAGDKRDHRNIPSYFAESSNAPVVAIPNYRLSRSNDHPERADIVHPMHIEDVYRSLLFAAHLDGQTGQTWPKPRRVVFAGHSCGAHILSHILFDQSQGGLEEEQRQQLIRFKSMVASYIFLDGIYDLEDLIDEYPGYADFVSTAFGDRTAWPAASIARMNELPKLPNVKLAVVHSVEDELLTMRQSKAWLDFLRQRHDAVEWDDVTLQGTHDGSLQNEGLGALLRRLARAPQ